MYICTHIPHIRFRCIAISADISFNIITMSIRVTLQRAFNTHTCILGYGHIHTYIYTHVSRWHNELKKIGKKPAEVCFLSFAIVLRSKIISLPLLQNEFERLMNNQNEICFSCSFLFLFSKFYFFPLFQLCFSFFIF